MIRNPYSHRLPWVPLLLFLVMSLGIILSGWQYYERAKKLVQTNAENELGAIADLKIRQIAAWRQDRLGDAAIISRNPFNALRIRPFLSRPSGAEPGADIQAWLNAYYKHADYQDVLLVDTNGTVRLAAGSVEGNIDAYDRSNLAAVLRARQPVLSDFHQAEVEDDVHLDMYCPLLDWTESGATNTPCIGMIMFEIDPHHFLYPLIRTWPGPSRTAETLLIRREGDTVLYLNELRCRHNNALKFRLPITQDKLPAAMAVQGREGFIEGKDYRGEQVFAVARHVPDTPWYLVAKEDKSELLAPLREQAQTIVLRVGGLILITGLVLLALWMRYSAKVYRRHLEGERERQQLVLRFDYLTRYANDIIILLDQQQALIEVNERACSTYGYTRAEMLRLHVADFQPPDIRAGIDEVFQRAILEEGVIYETRHQRRDGATFPVEISLRAFKTDKKTYYQAIIRDITERKRAEAALRLSELHLQVILEATADGILAVDNKGQVLKTNRRFAELWQIPQSLLESRDDQALLAFVLGQLSEPEAFLKKVQALYGSDETDMDTLSFKDGRVFERYSSPLLIEGAVIGRVWSFRDITERKRAAEMLRDSEAKYRIFFETSADGILIADIETKTFTYANPALCRMLGYTEEELRTMGLADIHPKEDVPRVIAEFEMLARGKKTLAMDIPCLRKDGTIIYADVNSTTVSLDGRPHAVGFFRDITERKLAQEAHTRLVTAIEQAAEIIVITDAQGLIQYVNPAFETVTGYACTEAVGQNPRILKSGRQDAAFYREMWETIRSGKTWQGRFVNRKKDGALYTEEATISPVRDAAGAIINYSAVKRDITAELNIQAQLNQVQKMESVGLLAGGVAHDFNNILQIVLGNVELALAQTEPDNPLRPDLEEVQKAGRRGADLIRQLLGFARKQTIAPRTMDLNKTVENMLKMLRRLIGEHIEMVWTPHAGLWPIRMDPVQIDQILVNLCANARDVITGGGTVQIATKNVRVDEFHAARHDGVAPGDYVLLTVSDTGCGMDKETQDKIFEPFFTTKAVGKGTGLGMATVYGIVQQNHGHISVYSDPGMGATFHIYLPRHMGNDAAPAAEGPAKPLARGCETVLLVEDDSSLLELCGRMLRELGYSVLAAGTSGVALRLAEEHADEIRLLVTDIVMPGMNGRELAGQLKARHPDLKCLFMSGYTADIIAHQGILEGIGHFIQKPFSANDLAAKVREALAGA